MEYHLRNLDTKIDQVRSAHGAMILWEVQPPTDFSTKPCFQQLNLLPLTEMKILCVFRLKDGRTKFMASRFEF